jgi:hypothetical protein
VLALERLRPVIVALDALVGQTVELGALGAGTHRPTSDARNFAIGADKSVLTQALSASLGWARSC